MISAISTYSAIFEMELRTQGPGHLGFARPPDAHHDQDEGLWTPYPHASIPLPAHADCLIYGYGSLGFLVSQINGMAASQNEQGQGVRQQHDLHCIENDLKHWHNTLPLCLRLRPEASSHVLALQ